MSKEWLLNQAMNRWGLNRKTRVGPIAEMQRQSGATTLEEWLDYYHAHGKTEAELNALGNALFAHLKIEVAAELASISRDDARTYIKDLVGRKSFGGHSHENTARDWLGANTGVVFQPAPDEWDRSFGVDAFIRLRGGIVGVQVKPLSFMKGSVHDWQRNLSAANARFAAQHGGKTFIVVYDGDRIKNPEVAEAIRDQIRAWR